MPGRSSESWHPCQGTQSLECWASPRGFTDRDLRVSVSLRAWLIRAEGRQQAADGVMRRCFQLAN
jgi:hypothetical protein